MLLLQLLLLLLLQLQNIVHNVLINTYRVTRAYQVILQKVTSILRRSVDSLPSRLYNYTQAKEKAFSYYIAAEFSGSSLTQQLIVGDGETYRGYFNAPLKPVSVYRIYFRAATQGLNGVSIAQKLK